MFSCDNLGDCIVYECLLQEPMEANGDATASIEIDFTFSKVTLVYFPQLLNDLIPFSYKFLRNYINYPRHLLLKSLWMTRK